MKEFYKNYNLVSEDEELAEDTAVKYYYVVKALFQTKIMKMWKKWELT